MDLRELVAVTVRRRWAFLTVLVVAVLAGGAFALARTPEYESTVVLALTPANAQGQAAFAADHLAALMGTYAETAKSSSNRRRAEALLGGPLHATLDATTERGTGVLRISARAESRRGAQVAAGAAARAFGSTLGPSDPLSAEVVDGPDLPTVAVQPRPPIVLAASALLGLLGGVLLALAMDRLRPRVRTAADVAALTSAPVLGRIPRRLAKDSPEWATNAARPLPPSIRALRANLEPWLDEHRGCVQVSSPTRAPGARLLVAALGVALARVGRPTVVVDADLHHPGLHGLFGMAGAPGLGEALAAGRQPEILPTTHEHLWVIPAGSASREPDELLRVGLASVLSRLSSLGCLVLVASPPVLADADARTVARAVNGVLLVVEAGSERPADLRAAVDALELVGAPVLGIVLDGATEGSGSDTPPVPDAGGVVARTATPADRREGVGPAGAPGVEAS